MATLRIAQTLAQAAQRATESFRQGDWAQTERLCRQILDANADHYDALSLLGIVTAQTQRAQEGVALLTRAAALRPRQPEAHSNLGNVLHALRRHEDALACYDRALRLKPGYAAAMNNRGQVLRELERYDEALACHDRALLLKPDYPEAHNHRGAALRELGRHEEALACYNRALARRPDYVEALNNRGVALTDLKRHEEALASYALALSLRPNYSEALNNRGVALGDLGRPAEALACYERALAMRPDDAEALNNCGNALCDLKRNEEAIASYEDALVIAPHAANVHWNLAFCRLRLGDFARGWLENEWRWKRPEWASVRREYPQPLWLGSESLEKKTLLLHHEQGLGDTLQFCRYAKLAAARGAKVLLVVQPALLPLLTDLDGVAQMLPTDADLPAFDLHCPLLSLPLAFGTRLDTIPAPANIRSDPSRVATWRERLGAKTTPRVGLAWSGNPGHKNDRNRSLALTALLPALSDHVQWISLQKDVRAIDASVLASRTDIVHCGEQLQDFADTAALIDLMDVVVTVDTSVAHLAGAMGKTVWILLPFNPDWRWLLDRDDSPWYPTARLFRQAAPGDWSGVVDRVRQALDSQLESSLSSRQS